jgi:hypothetical protein
MFYIGIANIYVGLPGRIPVGPIVWEKKCYTESKRGGTSYIQKRRLTVLVTSWVGTAFCNMLLKERIEVVRRRGRRPKQLLDDLKERREY